KAVDRGDYRFRDIADDIVQSLDIHLVASRTTVIAPLATFALVATGAERLVPCAGEDHHTDRMVPPSVLKRSEQLIYGERAKGVAYLRSVDGDRGDALFLFVEDVLELHDLLLCSLISSPCFTDPRPLTPDPFLAYHRQSAAHRQHLAGHKIRVR